MQTFPRHEERSSQILWPLAYWQETDVRKGSYVKTRTALALLIKTGEKVCVSACVFVSELKCWERFMCQILSMQCIGMSVCAESRTIQPPVVSTESFPASLLSPEEQRSNENHLVIN